MPSFPIHQLFFTFPKIFSPISTIFFKFPHYLFQFPRYFPKFPRYYFHCPRFPFKCSHITPNSNSQAFIRTFQALFSYHTPIFQIPRLSYKFPRAGRPLLPEKVSPLYDSSCDRLKHLSGQRLFHSKCICNPTSVLMTDI